MKLAWMLVFLLGCSTGERIVDVGSAPYQTAGIEQFFLPELPTWANGSLAARCARTLSVRFVDHTPLEKIHGLSFDQRVELQTQFNRKWKERYTAGLNTLTPQEEAVLFLETLEQVKGGVRVLKYPANLPVNVVWWDSLPQDSKGKAWLRNLGDQGNPVVLVSLCTDAPGIEAWVEAMEFAEYSFFTLGAESMGPMGLTGALQGGASMPLEAFFKEKQTTIWINGTQLPDEFPQQFSVKNLEGDHVRKIR
jgi:hypothetical protein